MEYLYDEIKGVAAFLMLINILTLLLPGEKYNKYFKVISGMMLIMIIINPFDKILNHSTSWQLFNKEAIIIEEKKSLEDINEEIYEISLRQYEEEMENQYIKSLNNEGFSIENINISMEVNDDSVEIKSIKVKIGKEAKNYGESLKNATSEYIKEYLTENLGVDEMKIVIEY